jgi:hypothetical protein
MILVAVVVLMIYELCSGSVAVCENEMLREMMKRVQMDG